MAALEPATIAAAQQTASDGATNSATIRLDQDFVTRKEVVQLEPLGIGNELAPGKVYIFARIYAPKEE